jgi:hypothetical protein
MQNKSQLNFNIDKLSLGPYLAGLWEGEGHISKINNNRNSKSNVKKTLYPYLAIRFPIKDLPLVNYLQDLFGGNILRKDKENALVLIIGSRQELINIVQVMNGFLRTPKLFEFNELINWLNESSNFNINIKLHSEDKSLLVLNGWLSGFFDVVGSFKIKYTEKVIDFYKVIHKGRIEVRIEIEQRMFHPKTNASFEPIMRLISDFFKVNLNISRHNLDKNYFVIEVTSLSKLKNFCNYLNQFPLITSKKNDFKDWFIVFDLICLNEHLTNEDRVKIKLIKNKINRKRTIFDWEHLK